MSAAGIRFSVAAENIAAGYTSPESVVEGWINSPGHRENILSDNKYLGVGLALGGIYGYYWTQCFAGDRSEIGRGMPSIRMASRVPLVWRSEERERQRCPFWVQTCENVREERGKQGDFR